MSLDLGVIGASLEVREKFHEAFEKFEHGIEHAEGKFEHFNLSLGTLAAGGAGAVAAGLLVVTTAVVGTFVALGELTEKTAEFAHETEVAAAKAQMSTDAYQEMAIAARLSGVSVDALTGASAKLEKSLGEGSSKTIEAVSDLGLSFEKLRNESPDKALSDVLEHLSGIENPARRAADAAALLGRGFREILPMAEHLAELKKRAHELGAVMSEEDIKAGAELAIKFKGVSIALESMEHNIGGAIANSEALHLVINTVTDAIVQATAWVNRHKEEIRKLVEVGLYYAVGAFRVLVAVIGGALLYFGYLNVVFDSAVGGAKMLVASILFLGKALASLEHGSIDGVKSAWNEYTKSLAKTTEETRKTVAAHLQGWGKALKVVDAVFDGAGKLQHGIEHAGTAAAVAAGHGKALGDSWQKLTKDQEQANAAAQKLGVELNKMWLGVTQAGMTQYQKAQSDIDQKADEFNVKLSEQLAKYPMLAATIAKLRTETTLWAQSMHAVVASQNAVEEAVRYQQQYLQSLIGWNDALNSLQPSLDRTLANLKMQLAAQVAQITLENTVDGQLTERGQNLIAVATATEGVKEQQAKLNEELRKMGEMGGLLDGLGGMFDALGGKIGKALGGVSKLGAGLLTDAGNFMKGDITQKITAVISGATKVFSAVKSLFHKPEYKKVMSEVGKEWGVDITEATAKAIESTESSAKVSRSVAELLNLDKIIEDSGKGASEFADKIGELMTAVADGTAPAKEGLAEIDKLFGQLADEGTAASKKLTAQLFQQAIATGELTANMKEYAQQAISELEAGADKILEGITNIAKDVPLGEMGSAAAEFFVGGFQAEIAEKGLVQALEDQGDKIVDFYNKLSAEGNTAAAALLAPFVQLANVINNQTDPSVKGFLEVLDGMSQQFGAMDKLGFVTLGTFTGLESAISGTANALSEAGVNGTALYQALAPQLGQIIDASKKYGFAIDANTQALIDQATAAGVAFPTDPMEQMVELLRSIAEVLGAEIPAAAKKAATAINAIPDPNVPAGIPAGPDSLAYGPPPGTPGYAGGSDGFQNYGSGMLAVLHGIEAVVTKPQLQAFTGEVVASTAGQMTAALPMTASTSFSGGGASAASSAGDGGHATLNELRSLRQDMRTVLPAMLQRAFRDAQIKTQAVKK
jgi:hypothetical protein